MNALVTEHISHDWTLFCWRNHYRLVDHDILQTVRHSSSLAAAISQKILIMLFTITWIAAGLLILGGVIRFVQIQREKR